MRKFISISILIFLAIFYSLKVFVPLSSFQNLYFPPKLGLVLVITLISNQLNSNIKASYTLITFFIMFSGLAYALSLTKLANNLATVSYLLLGITILYDIILSFGSKSRE